MNRVSTVREKDKAVIMATVRRFGPISQVGIHDLTRIRPATISPLVRELLASGKLNVVGHADNPMGRKQVMLRINEESGYVVALDFDEEFVDVALLDLHPRVRRSLRDPTNLASGIDGLLEQLFSCVERIIPQSGLQAQSIQGIGVGVPGLVNPSTGTVMMSSTIEFWKQIELKKLFETRFGISTVVENNSRTKAVAERVLGAGHMSEDMIYVEYGKGIGSGIIVGGKVLHGHSYSAGELGHTHVGADDRACKCGSFGCLEAIAGISALEREVQSELRNGSQSALGKNGDESHLDGWMVLKAARTGDKLCVAMVERLGHHLGLALANLVNLFNPSTIVLDSRLEAAGLQLLEQVSRVVRLQALKHATEGLGFRFGSLGSEVGVLGAGLLITERLFEVPLLKPPRFIIEHEAFATRGSKGTASRSVAARAGGTLASMPRAKLGT